MSHFSLPLRLYFLFSAKIVLSSEHPCLSLFSFISNNIAAEALSYISQVFQTQAPC